MEARSDYGERGGDRSEGRRLEGVAKVKRSENKIIRETEGK